MSEEREKDTVPVINPDDMGLWQLLFVAHLRGKSAANEVLTGERPAVDQTKLERNDRGELTVKSSKYKKSVKALMTAWDKKNNIAFSQRLLNHVLTMQNAQTLY